jgi:hypothetical protein
MNNFKNLGLAAGALVLSVSLTACGGGNDADAKKDGKSGSDDAGTSASGYQVNKLPSCDTYNDLLTTDSNFGADTTELLEDGLAMTAKEGHYGDWDSCDFWAGDVETTLSVELAPWGPDVATVGSLLTFPYDGSVDQGERYEDSSLDSDSMNGSEYLNAEFGQSFTVDPSLWDGGITRGVLRCHVNNIVPNAAEADSNTLNKLQLSSKPAAEQCNKILDAFTEAAK